MWKLEYIMLAVGAFLILICGSSLIKKSSELNGFRLGYTSACREIQWKTPTCSDLRDKLLGED